MKRCLVLVVVAAWCLAMVHALGQERPRVLMISIDGLMPSAYTAVGPSVIPVLRRLATEGAWARGVVGVLPSVTYPSHTTLITGVLPARHGIIDNRFVDPEDRSGGAWYWYARDITSPTLLSVAKDAGLRVASVQWPVTVGAPADVLYPEYYRSEHGENLSLLRALSTPNLLEAVEARRGSPFPWPPTDDATAEIAVFVAETYRPDLLLVHLVDLDSDEHETGPGSAQSLRTLERIDSLVGRIVTAFGGGHVLVAIVSDHGFLPLEWTLNPNRLFKDEGLITVNARGGITEWKAYFHSSGGSGYVYLKDPSDEVTRRRVAAILEGLARDPANGIRAVWDSAALLSKGGHPSAAFGIDMRNGFYSGRGHATLVEPAASKGGHGFDPERPDLHASLILSGPPFRGRGDIGIVRMTQVAPTLAAFLGIRLSDAADVPLTAVGSPPK